MRGIYQISISKYVYVGKAEVLEQRQRDHLKGLEDGKHFNPFAQRAFDRYGLSAGWFTVLEVVPEGENLLLREQHWFDIRVAELGRGRVMNAMRPEENPMDDPDVRVRHQEAMQNTTIKELSRQRRTALNKSPEFRKLVSDALAKPFAVVSPDGVVYRGRNLRAFCLDHDLCSGNMSRVVNGKLRQCKGWTRYAPDK